MTTTEGITLRDLVKLTSASRVRDIVRELWGSTPMLLIKSQDPDGDAPYLFSTPVDEGTSQTAEILLGERVINAYVTPGAAVVPVRKAGDRNPFGSVIVGRANNCDVRLQQNTVSKVHAYLNPPKQVGGVWRIQDSQSTNGTYVNGAQVEPGQVLRLYETCEIRFGTVNVVFLDADSLEAVLLYAREAWAEVEKKLRTRSSDTDSVPRPKNFDSTSWMSDV